MHTLIARTFVGLGVLCCAAFSFGDFMVERGLLSRMSLEGLEHILRSGSPPCRSWSRFVHSSSTHLLISVTPSSTVD